MNRGEGRPLLLALLEAAAGRAFAPSLPIPLVEVDWAIQAGLGPLLHGENERQPELLPAPLAARVRAADRLARLQSAERLEATGEILDRCGQSAGPITLLKGISIATEHHRRPHDRAMGDIDLLVERECASALERALLELGYRRLGGPRGLDYSRHHHGPPLVHARTGVCVEVHTALFPAHSAWSERPPFSPSSIRSELRPGSFAGRAVFRLSPELQLVYIATHAALDFHPAVGARALLDSLLLLRNTGAGLGWDRVCGWLDDRRIAAHLQLVIGYLDRRGLVPAETGIARVRDRLTALAPVELCVLDRIVDRHLVRGLPLVDRFGVNNRAIVWSTLIASPRSPWNFARLGWNLVFPPAHPDRFRPRYQLERLRSALFRGA
jgi:Uncharacterised nucleotidyltransferase